MRILALAVLLLISSGVHAAVEIKNQYFSLTLPGDWIEHPGSDAQQFVITSSARKAQVTVSALPLNAKGRDLGLIADKMLELRFKAEHDAAPDRKLSFETPWRSMPTGGGLQVNYMGHDSVGRYFFYTGFITETGVTSVTGELERGSEPALHAFYKEVLSNFGY